MTDSTPPLPAAAVEARVWEVLAQTEVIHLGPGHDVVLTPDAGWDLRGTGPTLVTGQWSGSLEMEFEVSEEQFWRMCTLFLGPQEVVAMKQELADLMAWEGEGGSCIQE